MSSIRKFGLAAMRIALFMSTRAENSPGINGCGIPIMTVGFRRLVVTELASLEQRDYAQLPADRFIAMARISNTLDGIDPGKGAADRNGGLS